jgi:membrane protein implicated in regulation of membrane protease activity
MQDYLDLLLWIGIAAGGLLILLLLISIFSGMDIGGDVDVDIGGDVDVDVGGDVDGHGDDAGFGIVKSVLTLLSVGAFTARAIILNSSWSWPLVTFASIMAAVAAVWLLAWFFRWLLRNQEEGNWHLWQAEGKVGEVYVPIPAGGKGRITVTVNNVNREMAAKSQDGDAMGTHQKVLVVDAKDDFVVVIPYEN